MFYFFVFCNSTTNFVTFSAILCSYALSSDKITVFTPFNFEHVSATFLQFLPATNTVIFELNLYAAEIVCNVASFNLLLLWSAKIKTGVEEKEEEKERGVEREEKTEGEDNWEEEEEEKEVEEDNDLDKVW